MNYFQFFLFPVFLFDFCYLSFVTFIAFHYNSKQSKITSSFLRNSIFDFIFIPEIPFKFGSKQMTFLENENSFEIFLFAEKHLLQEPRLSNEFSKSKQMMDISNAKTRRSSRNCEYKCWFTSLKFFFLLISYKYLQKIVLISINQRPKWIATDKNSINSH